MEGRQRLTIDLTGRPTVRKALLWSTEGENVRCGVCERKCVIAPGMLGFCGTRANINGSLYTLVYGDLSAMESRPIEIKPFYHYYPGTSAMTISTWGCNFKCPWCQNFHLSMAKPRPEKAWYTSPEHVVRQAILSGDKGVCVSFNEPTLLFEYSLELFKRARREGLYSCIVSNGYMSVDALKMMIESGLTGLKIDVKGGENSYRRFIQGADHEIPWRNASIALKYGVHVEIVYLVVPGVNDDMETIERAIGKHLEVLGPDTPLHFTRYFPAYKYTEPPTPVEKLEQAVEKAYEKGLNYVYIGNVPGHRYESTYCPGCGRKVIARHGLRVKMRLRNGRCSSCGHRIPIFP